MSPAPKFLIIASLFAVSCSVAVRNDESAPAHAPEVSKPAATAASVVGQGGSATRLYQANCAKCHGDRGQGGGGGTQSLLTKEKFDQKFDKPYFDAIKKGVPDAGMEAYGEALRDSEIWALVVHIRELQAEALRAAGGPSKPSDGVYRSKHHRFRVETVVDRDPGLRTPWAIDWLPDGRMLITNRPGWMVIAREGEVGPRVEGLPESMDIGQGGLMEVAVHPDYAKNGWIYLAYADPASGSRRAAMTKVVRGKLRFDGNTPRWTNQETIFAADPSTYTGSSIHFGCRIAFDGKGHLFFAIGERGNGNLAQDRTAPHGKVFRMRDDGTIPSDNPFASSTDPKVLRAIWSYGHRNPQGLAFGLDGTLWSTEHAPRGGDEVNRIQRGANYGWMQVSFGIHYSDMPFLTPWPKPQQDFVMPVFRWLPSTGACGLDVYRGSEFPEWKGDILAGGLVGQNVDRLRIVKDQVVEHEELVYGLGRVRDVAVGPDGLVYIVLNQPDKVVRLVPMR